MRPRRFLAAVLRRLLDPTHRVDLVVAAALALWPAVLAALIGAHRTVVVDGVAFAGYWERPNWLVHIVALPLALHLFRWSTGKVVPVWDAWPPRKAPEIIRLIDGDRGQSRAYAAMRDAVLSPYNLLAALAVMVAFHVFDMQEFFAVFGGRITDVTAVREPDWTVVGAFAPEVNAAANVLLVLSAYTVQFAELTMMVLFVVLLVRHNVFFLGRVYQARRVPAGEDDAYIVVDLDDPNRCLGFRRANEAFNTQVVCLTIAGAGLLTSRFANVTAVQNRALWDVITPGGRPFDASLVGELFPDVGQWVTSTGWLASLAFIAMPLLVKLLPRIPFTGGGPAQRSIVTYLREFLPASRWPFVGEPSVEQINWLAGRFADNAFWPTGNNRATQLFFFSLWVFLIILFPLLPEPGRMLPLAVFYLALGVLAMAGTWLMLQLLRWALAYVDVRLVTAPTVTVAPAISGSMPPLPLSGSRAGTATLATVASERSIGPGSMLGEFQILSQLGAGGMGAVFRAEDTRLGRQVALKVLPSEFTADAQRLARFEREAKLLASLNHPNIATLFSFDQDGPLRFLTMELVEGDNLAERLALGPLSLAETVRIGAEMCSALEQAHRRNIVHRDLKPANVMLTESGSKLLDFGLAKGTGQAATDSSGSGESKTALTTTGAIVGTLHYMAPEQLQSGTVDQRADIFALGAVLYEMATGKRAFPGNSQATIIGEVLHREPPSLAELQPQLPAALDGLVRRCLAKRAAERYQDVAEVRAALLALTSAEMAMPAIAAADAPALMVAVLPFSWPAGTADQAAIADGLVDELRVLLSDGYAGPVAAPGVGEADLLVQGSLRAAGERVRASVQLVDASSGRQLWAARYEGTLGDAFELQDELAGAIARDLLPRLPRSI